MAKLISSEDLSETLSLSHCADGFWLYDETRGMNLSIKAKTDKVAFVEALTYYQKRLSKVETAHNALRAKVDSFVSQFADNNDED